MVYRRGIVLVFLALALLLLPAVVLSNDGQSPRVPISLDESVYAGGENATLLIALGFVGSISIRVQGPDGTWRFAGDEVSVELPVEEGEYSAVVFDKASGAVLQDLRFSVGPSPISVPSAIRAGEPAMLRFRLAEDHQYRLSIASETERYDLLDGVAASLAFSPPAPGEYHVTLADTTADRVFVGRFVAAGQSFPRPSSTSDTSGGAQSVPGDLRLPLHETSAQAFGERGAVGRLPDPVALSSGLESHLGLTTQRLNDTSWGVTLTLDPQLLGELRGCHAKAKGAAEARCDVASVRARWLPDSELGDELLLEEMAELSAMPVVNLTPGASASVASVDYLAGTFSFIATFTEEGDAIKVGLHSLVVYLPRSGSHIAYSGTLTENTFTRASSTEFASNSYSLINTSDGYWWSEAGGTASLDTYVLVNYTVPAAPYTWVNVIAVGKCTSARDTLKIALWNYSSGSFVQKAIDGGVCSTSADSTLTYNISSAAELANFTSGGQLRVMLALHGASADDLDVNYMAAEFNTDDAPRWSSPELNTSAVYSSRAVRFNTTWTDDVGLSHYVFSINQSGTWVNSTPVAFSTGISTNVSVITAGAGQTVQWRFYANDSRGQWNMTEVQSFTVASPVVVSSAMVNDSRPGNGSRVNISASVTHVLGGTIDHVRAMIYLPNGTLNATLVMSQQGGVYANDTYVVPHLPIGNYTVAISANDTAGNASSVNVSFAPVLGLTGSASIAIDGAFGDWSGVLNITDLPDATRVLDGSGSEVWFTLGGGFNRTSSTTNTRPRSLVHAGNFSTGESMTAQPVIVNGVVYIRTMSGLTALNATNVSQRLANHSVPSSGSTPVPTVVGGVVYVGGSGMFYALNASNISQQLGNHTVNGSVEHAPAVAGGIVYFGTHLYLVYALNASNISQQIRNTTLEGSDTMRYSSPIVENGLLYFNSYLNRTWVLNASNISQRIGNVTIRGSGMYSPLALSRNVLYTGTEAGYLYALNASNLSQQLGNTSFANAGVSFAVSNDVLYAASNGILYAVNASNVSQRYGNFTSPHAGSGTVSTGQPVAAGDVVYFGAGEGIATTYGSLFVLNASNVSQQLDSYVMNAPPSAPSVANGVVYAGSAANTKVFFALTDRSTVSTLDGDIRAISVANDASNLYGKIGVAQGLDLSSPGTYARVYIGRGAGSSTSPEGASLPFAYSHRIQVGGGVCRVFSSADADLGPCSFANDSRTIELSAPYALLGVSPGDTLNLTVESATAGRRSDIAPDFNSYVSFTTTGVSITGVALNDSHPFNGSRLNISATASGIGVSLDKVWAQVSYPNGTPYQNLSMPSTGGSRYANVTFTVPSAPLGNYSVVIYANDTGGSVYSASAMPFAPVLDLRRTVAVTVDGSAAEWPAPSVIDGDDQFSIMNTINNWSSLSSMSGPYARYGAAMVYDPNLGTLLLFGGRNGTTGLTCDGSGSSYCNGTYAYNRTTGAWVPLSSSNPPPARYIFAMAFDPVLNATLLYGGAGASGCDGSANAQCNGTYMYNASSNSWRQLAPAVHPTARQGHGMAFNPVLNMTIIWGGYNAVVGCDSSGGNYCNGTYAYNASSNNWVALNAANPPAARNAMGMAHDLRSNLTIIFGGNIQTGGNCDSTGAPLCNRTYGYNATSNAWTNLNPPGQPTVRTEPEMAYDSLIGKIVLFGGDVSVGTCDGSSNRACDGTFAYDGSTNTWSTLNPTYFPSARFYHALAFDPVLNETVVFGGSNQLATCDGSGSGYCNGTFRFQYANYSAAEYLDIRSMDVASSGDSLYFRIDADAAAGSDESLLIYVGNSSSLADTGAGGRALATNYSYLLNATAATCQVYSAAGANIAPCGYGSSGVTKELSVELSAVGLVKGDTLTAAAETRAASGFSDAAPDPDSYVRFTILGISFTGITINDTRPLNGSRLNISATATGIGVTIDKVWAQVSYPNGTEYQNLSMPSVGGARYENTSFLVPGAPLGNYTVLIYANDTAGAVYSGGPGSFSPVLVLSRSLQVTVDGSAAEWPAGRDVADDFDSLTTQFPNWSALNPSTSPSSRAYVRLVFDEALNATMLFGGGVYAPGCDGAAGYECNGTHLYNTSANTWRQLAATTPPSPRESHMSTFDRALNATLLFGGTNSSRNFSDTYLYNASTTSWRSLSPSTPPGGRYNAILVYDPLINASIMFGGNIGSGGTCDGSGGVYCNGTYLYNASTNSWRSLGAGSPPAARYLSAAAFDPTLGAIVLFGGSGSSGCDGTGKTYCNGTYLYNASTNSWRSLAPANAPLGRQGAVMVYHPGLGGLVLYGGWSFGGGNCDSSGGEYCNGTYLYNATNNTWVPVAVNMPFTNRSLAGAAYDPNAEAMILFGGRREFVGCDGTDWCGGTYQLRLIDIDNSGSDLRSFSLAASTTHMHALVELNKSPSLSTSSSFYRLYFANGSSGSSSSPEGRPLAFSYTHRAQINGSACRVYSSAGVDLGACSYANDSTTLELSVPFSLLGAASGDTLDATFETASPAGRHDIAPDLSSSVLFTSSGVTISGVTVNDSRPLNGSRLNISATATGIGVTVDKIWAQVRFPNGSAYQNVSMSSAGGSRYENTSFLVPSAPLGNYSVTVYANDTAGQQYFSSSAQFAPVLALSQSATIMIDGLLNDWSGVAVLHDAQDDAVSAGYNLGLVATENWSKFHSDLNNTGYTMNTAAPNVSRHIANFTSGNIVVGGPAVAGGFVYVGSSDGRVYQLNASNIGQQIANYTIGSAVKSIPAVSGGYVYIGGGDGRVYQLNASNISRQIANFTIYAGIAVDSAPAVSGAYVYVGSMVGYLYQLNASNISQQIANFSGSQTISSSAVSGGYVYVGQSQIGLLYQLNASNISRQIANFSTASYVESSPAVGGGYVYIGDSSNTVYQLNASNISRQIANFSVPNIYKMITTPAVAGGYVYIGSTDRTVYQLNASNISQQIANYTTGGRVESSPAVAGGYVYVGSVDDCVYQLNASNISRQIANYTTGNDVYASPAVAGGFVYIGSNDGKVYQLGGIPALPSPDIVNVSVASDASHLFAMLQFNSTLNLSSPSQFIRGYIGNGTAGNDVSPQGYSLPFNYTQLVQINGSACNMYDSAGADIGDCTYANNSDTLELSVTFATLGLTIGEAVNVTFETSSASTRYDIAPDLSSSVLFTSSGVTISGVTVNDSRPLNGSRLNISATATGVGVTVDKVWALIFYPNGSAYQNVSLASRGASLYSNETFIVPAAPLGNYSITVYANDTGGAISSSGAAQFAPVLALSQSSNIIIDGVLTDWSALFRAADPSDDEGSGELWTPKSPASPPSARSGASFVFDPVREVSILFGGATSGNCDSSGTLQCNQTWWYNASANTWTAKSPTSPPTARYAASFAFDPTRNVSVLFGGRNTANCVEGAGQYCNQTWWYNASANTWTAKNPASPPSGRYGGSTVFDPTRNVSVLFGGYAGAGCDGLSGGYCNQTWWYNASANTWTAKNPASNPVGRQGGSFVFDPVRNVSILFGGFSGTDCNEGASTYCNQTWWYNASENTWTAKNPSSAPRARRYASFVFDPVRNVSILFGGYILGGCGEGSGDYCGWTWEYNASANTWTVRDPATSPVARDSASLVFDPVRNVSVLFGGTNSSGCGEGGSNECSWTWWHQEDAPVPPFDLLNYSLAHNATSLFAMLQTNGTINPTSSGNRYRVYLANGSTGASTSPEGNSLPLSYTHLLQINSSACAVYNRTYQIISTCSYQSSSNTLEIAVPLATLGLSTGQTVNATFETASSSDRYDLAPDPDSFVRFTTAGVTISGVNINDSRPLNGSRLNISATATGVGVTVDKVWAQVRYPNGTEYQNVSLALRGASLYSNETFIVPAAPLGNYSITVYANDTAGVVSSSAVVRFAPVLNLGNVSGMSIDGVFSDWTGIASAADILGDSAMYGSGTGGGSQENWTTFQMWNNRTGHTPNTIPSNISRQFANVSLGSGVRGAAVAGDYVYVTTYGGVIFQLNASNISQRIANFTTGTIVQAISVPAVEGLYVYFSGAEFFYQLNASNVSRQIANFSMGGAATKSPLVAGGFVYVGTNTGKIYQLNASNVSRQFANFSAPGLITAAATIWGGNLYVPSSFSNHFVHQLNASNISKQITNFTAYGTASAVAVADGSAYYADGSYVDRLNASNVSIEYEYGSLETSSGNGAVAVANGFLYLGDSYGYFHQLNASNVTRRIANTSIGQDAIINLPVIAGGYVFVSGSDNRTYQLNATNISRRIANYTMSNASWGSLVVARGFLFVGDDSGYLYQLGNGTTGSPGTPGPDIVNVSLANNASHLHAKLQVNGSIDPANASEYYRVYLGNGTSGASAAPEGGSLPFAFTHRIEVSGGACDVYTSAGADIGDCTYANNSDALELSVAFATIGLVIGEAVNVTFETASASGRYDLAPDMNSHLRYTLLSVDQQSGPPSVSSVTGISAVTPIAAQSVTVLVNFTAVNPAGVAGIDDSSARAVFNRSGHSFSGNCTPNDQDSTSTIFNCSVLMPYWAPAGSWQVNVSFNNSTTTASNSTTSFTHNTLEAFSLSPAGLDLGTLSPGGGWQTAATPVLVDNRGNVNLSTLDLTAYDLVNASSSIGAGNLSVNTTNAPGKAAINNTPVRIPDASVDPDLPGVAQNLSLYISISTPAVSPGYYAGQQAWVVTSNG